MKKWLLAEPVPDEAYAVMSGMPRVLASLLWRRGIRTPEEADRFLNPSWERDVHDPFLFLDMRKAVDRLLTAIKDKEKIVIHGDYDADGVSGSVILHGTLKALGADVGVYLPHREKEGYGMAAATIEKLAAEGAKVIITCDCGISNGKEIALAVSKGIDVIVTDHHTLPPELPAAYAILHPLREGETYPFRYLTGGGVAFKLCQALSREASLPEGNEKWLLDMVSISTVADMGSLTGENRALVHYGLIVLNKTRRLGLGKLIDGVRRGEERIDSAGIGFRVAPRINAAGRMDHADAAFALLTAETDAQAVERAEVLHDRNRERQGATERIMTDARILAAEQKDKPGIVVAGEGWPAALCGLVAARLVDEHYRPVIALGRNEEGRYVGSGRSIPGFNVTAALHEASDTLVKFGGHPMACGLTIDGDERFEAFRERFVGTAGRELANVELVPRIDIESEIAVGEADSRLAHELRRMEPYGEGNPKPRFLVKNAVVATAQTVGQEGKHLRMLLTDGRGAKLKLIGFGFGAMLNQLSPGGRIDAVIELELNEWNGRVEAQGRVIDMRPL